MQAKTIDLLSSLLPDADGHSALGGAFHLPKVAKNKATERFVNKYRKVAFGWHAASELAHSGNKFPMPLYGRDLWVWRAYLHIADPSKWADRHIEEACGLNDREGERMSSIVKAMLLLPNTSFGEIAESTGLDVKTIQAYETLFYNVKDRVGERIYIGQVVYPDYKAVEFKSDYFDHVDMGDLLIRSGFAYQDIKQIEYAAGMSSNDFLNKLAADPNNETMLDNHLMANAMVLQSMNLGNQSMTGLTNARQLMMSKHAAGVNTSTSGVSFDGTNMYTDWQKSNREFSKMQLSMMKSMNVVDVSTVEEATAPTEAS